jgi:hypothetical protein
MGAEYIAIGFKSSISGGDSIELQPLSGNPQIIEQINAGADVESEMVAQYGEDRRS